MQARRLEAVLNTARGADDVGDEVDKLSAVSMQLTADLGWHIQNRSDYLSNRLFRNNPVLKLPTPSL